MSRYVYTENLYVNDELKGCIEYRESNMEQDRFDAGTEGGGNGYLDFWKDCTKCRNGIMELAKNQYILDDMKYRYGKLEKRPEQHFCYIEYEFHDNDYDVTIKQGKTEGAFCDPALFE